MHGKSVRRLKTVPSLFKTRRLPFFLNNYTFVEFLNGENHIPVLSPYYISMFYRELFEMLGLNVTIVLRMWICKNERFKIHNLSRSVTKKEVKTYISCIFGPNDIKSCGFHFCFYLIFLVICVQRTLFFKTKKFIHFSTIFL